MNPLSNEEFFKIFSDLIREEFNIPTTQAFLKIIAFEDLIEQKFIEFLKDYKLGFEKLQRPLLTDEYSKFINEKETPLKLYFQYLKEYLWKLMTFTTVTNYQLAYLLKSYDDCSICDIFALTDDFSLKFNICYILNKMKNNFFDQNGIEDIKSGHYQKLYDMLLLYSSDSALKWMDFSRVDNLFCVKFRPIILSFDFEMWHFFCAEEKEKSVILNLETEFTNYSKFCEQNEKFSMSPNGYQEYIRKILMEKERELKFNFKLIEEIKLISIFFFFNDLNMKETNQSLKNQIFYFLLVNLLSNEIMRSSKILQF